MRKRVVHARGAAGGGNKLLGGGGGGWGGVGSWKQPAWTAGARAGVGLRGAETCMAHVRAVTCAAADARCAATRARGARIGGGGSGGRRACGGVDSGGRGVGVGCESVRAAWARGQHRQ
eukprot:3859283-Rhodomonas_salina.2